MRNAAVYMVLPGGATASLTSFSFLADAMAEQSSAPLVAPALGAVILLGYAAVAAGLAVVIPLRRDLR